MKPLTYVGYAVARKTPTIPDVEGGWWGSRGGVAIAWPIDEIGGRNVDFS